MNIYLDMDDVVADWMKAACEYLDVERWDWGQLLPDHKWRRLKDNQRMYRTLPLRAGAEELVEWVTDYCNRTKSGLFFLTAVPHGNDVPWAFQDKVFWAYERFPHIPVFFGPYSHEKWVRCQPGDILIDDRPSNCEEWRRAGGLAHQYKNWSDCKVWLEETLK
jgi:5'(3')-deoxyribonucleotidase